MLNRRDFLKGLAVVTMSGVYSGPLFAATKERGGGLKSPERQTRVYRQDW